MGNKKKEDKNYFSIYLKDNLFYNSDTEKDYKFFFSQVNYQSKKNLTHYRVYKIKEKNFRYFLKVKKLQSFLIDNSSVLKIYNDQPIGFHCLFPKNLNFSEKKVVLGNYINPSLILSKSGFFLDKNGSEIIFQSIFNTFITQTSLLKKNQNDFIKKNEILGYELTYKKQAKDIVQGLPKIESLIEAYSNKNEVKDFTRSSIFFSKQIIKNSNISEIDIINNSFDHIHFQSLFTNNIIVCYKRLFYKLVPISSLYLYKKFKASTSYQSLFSGNKLEKSSFLVRSNDKDSYELENYGLISQNGKKKFQYNSKIVDSLNNKDKYYQDKYWPIYTNSIWLYKLEKFRLLKWLKISPIIWFPGISRYLKNTYKSYGFLGLSKSINSNLIIKSTKGKYYYLELVNTLEKHNNFITKIADNNQLLFSSIQSNKLKFDFFNNFLNFVYLGENVFQNILNIQKLLNTLFNYHLLLDGSYFGLLKSILKFQNILSLSIEDSYKSQGVKISKKNIEIIVKQMLDKVIIEDPKNINLLPLETIKLVIIKEICKSIKKYNNSNWIKKNKKSLDKKRNFYKFENFPIFRPKLFSTTSSIFYKEGFLTQAGFQNTKKVLTKAAIEGSVDWLTNLKQRVIVGQVLPAGSTFFNSKYNLDSIYLFKNSQIYDAK